jgi:hypothetical protein
MRAEDLPAAAFWRPPGLRSPAHGSAGRHAPSPATRARPRLPHQPSSGRDRARPGCGAQTRARRTSGAMTALPRGRSCASSAALRSRSVWSTTCRGRHVCTGTACTRRMAWTGYPASPRRRSLPARASTIASRRLTPARSGTTRRTILPDSSAAGSPARWWSRRRRPSRSTATCRSCCQIGGLRRTARSMPATRGTGPRI